MSPMTPEIKQKIEDKAKELYPFSQNASGYDVNNDARHSFIKGAETAISDLGLVPKEHTCVWRSIESEKDLPKERGWYYLKGFGEKHLWFDGKNFIFNNAPVTIMGICYWLDESGTVSVSEEVKRLRSILIICHNSLKTYGQHPLIDEQVNNILSVT